MDEDLIPHLTYAEKRTAMLIEAKEKNIRPTMLQKKYGITLGGMKEAKQLKAQIWNELTTTILTEGADKYVRELMKLNGKAFLQHYSIILQYLKPRAAQEINLTIQNKFDIGFEDHQDIIDIKINEEE